MTGRVSKATVTLDGLSHTFPHDVNMLLVSPSGSNVLVMSHTGGAYGVTNLDLVFDDAATVSLPNYGLITNGTYKPSSYEGPVALPGTAPASSYQSALSGMVWSNPNGAWSEAAWVGGRRSAAPINPADSATITMPSCSAPVNSMPASTNCVRGIEPASFLASKRAIFSNEPSKATA